MLREDPISAAAERGPWPWGSAQWPEEVSKERLNFFFFLTKAIQEMPVQNVSTFPSFLGSPFLDPCGEAFHARSTGLCHTVAH